MGTFLHPVTLVGPGGETTLEALVDTGATFSKAPRAVLEGLGVRPTRRMSFDLADGRAVEYDLGRVIIRINGDEEWTLCPFGEPSSEPILGVHILEGLGLGVDPVRRAFIPVRGKLMRSTPPQAY